MEMVLRQRQVLLRNPPANLLAAFLLKSYSIIFKAKFSSVPSWVNSTFAAIQAHNIQCKWITNQQRFVLRAVGALKVCVYLCWSRMRHQAHSQKTIVERVTLLYCLEKKYGREMKMGKNHLHFTYKVLGEGEGLNKHIFFKYDCSMCFMISWFS